MYVKNRAELTTCGNLRGRAAVLDIMEAGLAAVDPYARTRQLIRREGDLLHIGGCPEMDLSGYGDETIDLSGIEHVYVIGAGKTVQRQAKALEDVLGDRLSAGALTIKKGEAICLQRIEVTEGAHPVPDAQSVAGTRKIVELARRAGERDLVFGLFSSGASSLCVLPLEGYDLEDVRTVYRLAIEYGDQSVIWRVMRYFSAVTSGRIMELCHPARVVNLLMSFKPYAPWRGTLPATEGWITPWPPGPRRLAEAARELRAMPWWGKLPPAMRSALERRDPCCEVPDLEAFRRIRCSYWQPVEYRRMLEESARQAEASGFRGVILGSWWGVESRHAAEVMLGMARDCLRYGTPFAPPVALLSSGEMTVAVGETTGVGGRNQEFALAAALKLAEGECPGVIVGAVDSDGTDGPGMQLTEGHAGRFRCLAGGLVDEQTAPAARSCGLALAAELRNHNSTPPLLRLGSGVVTGNTGLCAGDLRVVLVPRQAG